MATSSLHSLQVSEAESQRQCVPFTGMIPVFGLFLILLELYGMGGIYGMRAKFDSFD